MSYKSSKASSIGVKKTGFSPGDLVALRSVYAQEHGVWLWQQSLGHSSEQMQLQWMPGVLALLIKEMKGKHWTRTVLLLEDKLCEIDIRNEDTHYVYEKYIGPNV